MKYDKKNQLGLSCAKLRASLDLSGFDWIISNAFFLISILIFIDLILIEE